MICSREFDKFHSPAKRKKNVRMNSSKRMFVTGEYDERQKPFVSHKWYYHLNSSDILTLRAGWHAVQGS